MNFQSIRTYPMLLSTTRTLHTTVASFAPLYFSLCISIRTCMAGIHFTTLTRHLYRLRRYCLSNISRFNRIIVPFTQMTKPMPEAMMTIHYLTISTPLQVAASAYDFPLPTIIPDDADASHQQHLPCNNTYMPRIKMPEMVKLWLSLATQSQRTISGSKDNPSDGAIQAILQDQSDYSP